MRLSPSAKILLMVAVLIAVAIPLPLLLSSPSVPPESPAIHRTPDLFLSVSTDKDIYSAGEPVHIVATIVNTGAWPEQLPLRSTCGASFVVLDERDSIVFDESTHRSCRPTEATLVLAPGSSFEVNLSWNQNSDAGGQVPADRYYRIRGVPPSPAPFPGYVDSRFILIVPAPQLPNLVFSARTNRPVYVAGDTARIMWTLTNLGPGTFTMWSTPCYTQFLILDIEGRAIYNSSKWWGCVQVTGKIVIEPGESRNYSLPWDLTTDEGKAVPAGHDYQVLPSFLWPLANPHQRLVSRTDLATFSVQESRA